MTYEYAALAYSLLTGLFAFYTLHVSMTTKNKKIFYIWFLVFTIASWSGIEWFYWLSGYDMFNLILYPAVPLDFFFLSWIAFAGWYGKKIMQIDIFKIWLVVLGVIFAVARVCMNCVHF